MTLYLCDDFNAFIEHFENIPIVDTESEQFYRAFEYYYKRYCAKVFTTDSNKLTEALGIRKGKTQRKKTMIDSFNMLGLPYEIKKEKMLVFEKEVN